VWSCPLERGERPASPSSSLQTTVKTHVAHILTKLGLNDGAQAVVVAWESRLVVPGDATNYTGPQGGP